MWPPYIVPVTGIACTETQPSYLATSRISVVLATLKRAITDPPPSYQDEAGWISPGPG